MRAGLPYDLHYLVRYDVELSSGKVDKLVVIVHTISYAGSNIRRQISDGDYSRTDGVDSLASMVN